MGELKNGVIDESNRLLIQIEELSKLQHGLADAIV